MFDLINQRSTSQSRITYARDEDTSSSSILEELSIRVDCPTSCDELLLGPPQAFRVDVPFRRN